MVLYYDKNAKKVQVSAGTAIFLGAMTDSYFANFPDLIGQAGSNEIFVREPFSYDPDIEW